MNHLFANRMNHLFANRMNHKKKPIQNTKYINFKVNKQPIHSPLYKTHSFLNLNFRVHFTVTGLREYAYKHAPVHSMSGKPSLEEIITIQPLHNIFDSGNDKTYFLTYIFYKTGDSFNGYGYLTCKSFQGTSIRGMIVVTPLTTEILAHNLFTNTPYPNIPNYHHENIYIYI